MNTNSIEVVRSGIQRAGKELRSAFTVPQYSEQEQADRRTLIRNGLAAAAGLQLASSLSLELPSTFGVSTAQAESISIAGGAAFRRSPFSYWPNGNGLADVLTKFTAAYTDETATSWTENIDNVGRFITTARGMTGAGQGICNGASNWRSRQLRETPAVSYLGGKAFPATEIDAIASVWCYGDSNQPEEFGGVSFPSGATFDNRKGRDNPNFIWNMFWEYIGRQGVPVVIERSTIANEVWTQPIDSFSGNKTDLGNGLTRLDLVLDGPNYTQSTQVRLPIAISYEIDDSDLNKAGRQLSGPTLRMVWRPRAGHYIPGYQIEGNVFSLPMLKDGLRPLLDYSNAEWLAIRTPAA